MTQHHHLLIFAPRNCCVVCTWSSSPSRGSNLYNSLKCAVSDDIDAEPAYVHQACNVCSAVIGLDDVDSKHVVGDVDSKQAAIGLTPVHVGFFDRAAFSFT